MAKVTGILEAIEVAPLTVGRMTVWIRGITPLICNRMAEKAKRTLILGGGKKTKAEKEQTLKHDPESEFINSMTRRVVDGPTRVLFPAPAVKGAMSTAALETKGTNKTQIGRLAWVEGYSLDVYGIPQLLMSVVRSADMNKTPDIRTRAIFAQWCAPVTICFIKPQLGEQTIIQLLSNAGIIIGIGDFRQEKGKGNYGQFSVVSEAECKDIVKTGGMKHQDAALKNITCFDDESAELLAWWTAEVKKSGKDSLRLAV